MGMERWRIEVERCPRCAREALRVEYRQIGDGPFEFVVARCRNCSSVEEAARLHPTGDPAACEGYIRQWW